MSSNQFVSIRASHTHTHTLIVVVIVAGGWIKYSHLIWHTKYRKIKKVFNFQQQQKIISILNSFLSPFIISFLTFFPACECVSLSYWSSLSLTLSQALSSYLFVEFSNIYKRIKIKKLKRKYKEKWRKQKKRRLERWDSRVEKLLPSWSLAQAHNK